MINSNNIWTILGIVPTTDIAVIKSAYATKAKEYHPEDHPEEFQELQKAYKSAVKYAKQTKGEISLVEIAAEQLLNEKMETPVVQKAEQPEGLQQKSQKESQEEKKLQAQEEDNFEQNMNFDYGAVDQEALEEQFFQDFLNIAMNPYLMNNIVGWKWFLEQAEYQHLFLHDDFRKKLVTKMYYLKGWHKETIRFFDQWLQKYQGEQNQEIENFYWKLKKYRIWSEKFFSVERWVTNQQKTIHEIILNRVKKQGESGTLQEEISAASYIRLYLQYAAANQEQINRQYKQNRLGSLVVTNLIVVCIAGVIWGSVVGHDISEGKSSVQQQMQERNENFNQERVENLKKYREESQEQSLYTLPSQETEQETESSMESADE